MQAPLRDIVRKGRAGVVASLMFGVCLALPAHTDAQAPAAKTSQKDTPMTRHAAGAFDAKTTPLPADDSTGGGDIGRYVLATQYHGDLEPTAKGGWLGAGHTRQRGCG